MQAGNVAATVGKWAYKRSILDIQSEAGVMVHLLRDAGFENSYGLDNSPAVTALWEHEDAIIIAEPHDTGLPDNSFDLVTWFGMYETERLDCTVSDVLNEMKRLTTGYMVVQPFKQATNRCYKDALAFFMENRLNVETENKHLGYFFLSKG